MTLSSGSCGSTRFNAATVRKVRRKESKAAAKLLGAIYHDSIADDLESLYDLSLLRKVAAAVRKVKPRIILTHSPQDYMEDHTNTCRLVVTAAFARGMPNFKAIPRARAVQGDVTVYHAMPHGLLDSLRQPILPDCFVDTTGVHATKREALGAHRSQKEWLDASQGMDSYLKTMDALSLEVGRMSSRFQHAEGWRRHLHLGFSATDDDPLRHELKEKFLCRES